MKKSLNLHQEEYNNETENHKFKEPENTSNLLFDEQDEENEEIENEKDSKIADTLQKRI